MSICMNRSLRCGLLVMAVGAVLTAPRVAHAYVDPGSAGFIIVSILSFLAAIGYVVRTFFSRLKDRLLRWLKNLRNNVSS